MPTISASPGSVVPCRLDAGAGHAGMIPAPEETDAARVQQTASGSMAGVIPRRLEEDGRGARPAGSV